MKCYEVSWLGVVDGIGLSGDADGRFCVKIAGPAGQQEWPAQYVSVAKLTEGFLAELNKTTVGGAFSVIITKVHRCDAEVTSHERVRDDDAASTLWLKEEREPSTDVLVHVNINCIPTEPRILVDGGEILAITDMPANGTFCNCKSALVRLRRGGKITCESFEDQFRWLGWNRVECGFDVILDESGVLSKVMASDRVKT